MSRACGNFLPHTGGFADFFENKGHTSRRKVVLRFYYYYYYSPRLGLLEEKIGSCVVGADHLNNAFASFFVSYGVDAKVTMRI